MAEQQTRDTLSQAAQWLGGTGALAALGVFVKGLANGSTAQEKDLRDGLASRVDKLEGKVDGLEKRLDNVTRNRDSWRYACFTARAVAWELARKHGETMLAWEDPKEEPNV